MQMNERTRKSIELKDAILNELSKKHLTCGDIKTMFKLTNTYCSSCLNSLKRYGLIAPLPNQSRYGKVLYQRISNDTFANVIAKVLNENAKARKHNFDFMHVEKPKTPNARVVTSNDYHSTGNKSKTNAWRGYNSMGNL